MAMSTLNRLPNLRLDPEGDDPHTVTARIVVSYLAVQHYGLTLTATAAALSVFKQSVLRGVTAGDRVLAAAGWTATDLLQE